MTRVYIQFIMLNALFLIPALPFAGFLILALLGRRFSRRSAAIVGTGSVGISALLALVLAVDFLGASPRIDAFIQTFWTWFRIGEYEPAVSFLLDPLSLVMVLVVTVVGFLIHLYSAEFMEGEEGYSRFFAYMNLFAAFMLTLVLADNLLLLYLGWEGVGLCSYFLIGFWYRDPANGAAARKAFVVTRVGDTAMAVGLFLLFTELGTLDIRELMQRAIQQWPAGSPTAVLAAGLLLGGAVGKSAQLPLQTWLPDAMAGPSPVSALIHAATMVTAGVYLIARSHLLFTLAPQVQFAVAVIGALTLLLAALSALTQKDIKRVLAYSTMSQIGYMFLALGVGAWSAAIFHLMTHAFFKALLFLAAGVVILAQHHEHDMFRMGGLRKRLPFVFWTFLTGAASLSALPLITSGFYSKDLILWSAWSSDRGSTLLWGAGIAGAFITALYAFRMVFIVFLGDEKTSLSRSPGLRMKTPLAVLALLSVIGGYEFVELPGVLDEFFPAPGMLSDLTADRHALEIIAAVISMTGIVIAYFLYVSRPQIPETLLKNSLAASLHRLWHSGWSFDRFYGILLVDPFRRIARLNKEDFIDSAYDGLAAVIRAAHRLFSSTQTGNLRWYAMGIALGAVVFLSLALFVP